MGSCVSVAEARVSEEATNHRRRLSTVDVIYMIKKRWRS